MVIVAPELIAPDGGGGLLNADLGSLSLPIHKRVGKPTGP